MKKKISLCLICSITILGLCGCGSNSVVGNTYEQEIKDDMGSTYSSYYFKDDNSVESKIILTFDGEELSNSVDTYTYTIEGDIITIDNGYDDNTYKISGSCLINTNNEKVKYCK